MCSKKTGKPEPSLARLPHELGLITQTEQAHRQAIGDGRFRNGRLPTEVVLVEQLGA